MLPRLACLAYLIDGAVASLFDPPSLDAVLLLGSRSFDRVGRFCERLSVQDLELGDVGLGLTPQLCDRLAVRLRKGVAVGSLDALGFETFQRELVSGLEG